MTFANVVLSGAAIVAVWVTPSGFGAMVGNFAAIVLGRSVEERSDWTACGGAVGCVVGFLAMLLAIAMVTKL
ncbi:MAG TPA: hypothetical protein VH299_15255 [Solirubrobacterales bacterium]|jgi:uncharacterized protein YqgC (DUF456 family)|nr:hypothetical protein [Solirubrobacterales bacterium]